MIKQRTTLAYKIKCISGGTQLGHNYFLFLLVHTLFLVFTKIPGVFINMLLMNQTRDVNTTLVYNGAIFAACACMMVFSAQIMHWTGSKITAAIGIIGYNILYLCYILFQSRIGEYYMLFGLFNGMADGFYYISYGSMVLAYTEVENRDSGMAIISTCSALVNLLIPLVSGSIISAVGGNRGYGVIFILAFATAFCALLAVFALPDERKRKEKQRVKYVKFLGLLKKYPQIFYGLLGETFKGTREGAFLFVLNIILYQLVKSEFLIGVNSFLTGMGAVLCFWFMSHFIRPGNRRRYMMGSIMILLAGTLLCLRFLNPAAVILFSVVNAFFAGMIEISCYTTFFDVSQSVKEAEAYTPELLAFHELFVVTGRCIGLFAFGVMNAVFEADIFVQVESLFFLTLVQFLTVYCCRKAQKAAAGS